MAKIRQISLEGIIFALVGVILCAAALITLARPSEYQAIARMKVLRDVHFSGPVDPVFSDPYFIQTEFEVVQSEAVLGKVVEKLGLVAKWNKRVGAGNERKKVEPVDVLRQLRRRMDLRVIKNTELIEIRVRSDEPSEAAQIANSVAETFQNLRLQQNQTVNAEAENQSSRRVTYAVDLVDRTIPAARPISPNRPLAGAAGIFGSLLLVLGIYFSTQINSFGYA